MNPKFLIILCFLLFSNCGMKEEKKIESYKLEIIEADILMSKLAEQEGFNVALGKFASDEFVKFSGGGHPIIGKKEFEKAFKDKPGPRTLTWKPVKADVGNSGDLGYTWGNWTFVLPDTVLYGNYFTVWKKQIDGKWLMALDGGNETPPPGN